MSTNKSTTLHIVKGNTIDQSSNFRDNGNGGEPPMDKDKYVTHGELEFVMKRSFIIWIIDSLNLIATWINVLLK